MNFRDIYKVSTQNAVKNNQTSAPETLSMGIMDSLLLSESRSHETSFDDSERRKKAHLPTKHRELEVISLSRLHLEPLRVPGRWRAGRAGGAVSLRGPSERRNFHMGAYDQFAENREKFGVLSEFDMTMYTTHVNAADVPLYPRPSLTT